MGRRPPRQFERSASYGRMLEPISTLSTMRDASGAKALTTTERDEREARRKTTPAPRSRSARFAGNRRNPTDDDVPEYAP